MMPKKTKNVSAVNLRVLEQEEDKDLDCESVFGQIMREKLRSGEKYLRIGRNGKGR
jgi:hypothetical protein